MIEGILTGKFIEGFPAIPSQYHDVARRVLRNCINDALNHEKRNEERRWAIGLKYPDTLDAIRIEINGRECPELREAVLEITNKGREREIRELPQTPVAEFKPFARFLKRYGIMSNYRIYQLIQEILQSHQISRSEKNIREALDLKNTPTREEISKKI